jgi:hypothetical protein
MNRFNGYAADNFPFRDGFRAINSVLVFYIYGQSDKSGLYIDDYGFGEFKVTSPESVEQFSKKILTVAESLNDVDIYYAIIPDKSIYSNKYLPGFNLMLIEQIMNDYLDTDLYTYIDISEALDADSYYSTDLHWNQVMLNGVLDKLEASMGLNFDLSLFSEEYICEFYGVYPGQLALPSRSDSLRYMENQSITAMYLNEWTMEPEPGLVYNPNKLSELDAYDFFLSGAQPLVILENTDLDSDRVLYLFRDSFSSSLAPLLASTYSKIYLIDLRYIDMRILSRFVEFKPGSDALFIYSSLVINNPDILQVG